MSGQNNIKEFPDLSEKLTAPTKRSLFERQKAEAEAKRAREEAETAAVYEDFVKSFENEGSSSSKGFGSNSASRGGDIPAPSGPRIASGPPKRHFAPGGRSSGPGSLGPPPNLSRNRAYDGSRPFDKGIDRGRFAFDDPTPATVDATTAFRTSDDEEEKDDEGKDAERAAPKPTLQLSSLPPGTSPAVIKSLIPPLLTVDGVRIIPPNSNTSTNSMERKSMAAIVTLAKETPASDIDTVVNTLQNKYLGYGFNLSISRHLSSAALGALNNTAPAVSSGLASLPFGAQAVVTAPGGSMSRAPPPSDMHRGGFAPPSSYAQSTHVRNQPQTQVKVHPPSDIHQLRVIHKTMEALLTHGPEFEALLMSRPEVQKEEKWSWIWNPRSTGAVWYRWRLWEILTGSSCRSQGRSRFGEPPHSLFDGAAPWAEPEDPLPFEFSTRLDELISDSDYNSSDEEESGDEEDEARKRRRQFHGGPGPPNDGGLGTASEEQTFLNPLQKTKLTYLLARLPTSTARLRKGDISRITSFAISRAGQGAEEVVDMIVSNILQPFAWSRHTNSANPGLEIEADIDGVEGEEEKPKEHSMDKKDAKDDVSASTLIGLYVMSDILSASSTSGVRHAWRYRALFENALTLRKVFPYLGRLEKTLGWGRLRAEKWRRSINSVMQLWEGWCVFPAGTHEGFVEAFANPPLTKEEEEAEKEKEKEKSLLKATAKPKWKTVDPNEMADSGTEATGATEDMDVDGTPLAEIDANEDLDGEPMNDLDGEPMSDVDGEPMTDDDGSQVGDGPEMPSLAPAADNTEAGKAAELAAAVERETAAARARRQRPKAEDMFADSDDE